MNDLLRFILSQEDQFRRSFFANPAGSWAVFAHNKAEPDYLLYFPISQRNATQTPTATSQMSISGRMLSAGRLALDWFQLQMELHKDFRSRLVHI